MKAPKDQWVIQIDVTNACVRKCANCTRFCGFHKKPYFMDYDYFCKAVDSLEGHPGLIGVMGGEPTLHPRFADMCKYLQTKIPEQYKVKDRSLYYPTDSFIEVRRRSELKQYEIHEYADGPRPIIQGAGLWTSMTRLYRDNLEIIQDTFNFQNLNDHTNISYHQPVLVSRKDMGIDDKTWEKLREKCWVNQQWSGSITPKGCFFCGEAGALDLLYDGPGGLPLEKGWWKKDISEFKDQFHWCEYCGIPLKTFARDAREQVTDISKTNYSILKQKDTAVFKDENINVLEIEKGFILENSIKSTKKYHGVSYMEDAQSRVSEKTPIYAGRIIGVLLCYGAADINQNVLQKNLDTLDQIFVVVNGEMGKVIRRDNVEENNDGRRLHYEDLRSAFGENEYLFLFTPEVIAGGLKKLKETVINPGVLHYMDFSRKNADGCFVSSVAGSKGKCALINSSAASIDYLKQDKPLTDQVFKDMVRAWNPEKRLVLTDSMNKTMYGVKTGNKTKTYARRVMDGTEFLIRCLREKGVVKTCSYAVFFLKKYGIKLTNQKIKNRIL